MHPQTLCAGGCTNLTTLKNEWHLKMNVSSFGVTSKFYFGSVSLETRCNAYAHIPCVQNLMIHNSSALTSSSVSTIRVTFVCLSLGGEGGCPRCAACFPLYGRRWHSAVHQWCVRPAVTMGTLLPLGFLWRQTVPEQTGPGRPRPGGPARHVWRAGTNTVLLSRSKSYNIGYLPVQVIESDPVCFGHIKTTAIAS